MDRALLKEAAQRQLKADYGIAAMLEDLPGEIDLNFRATSKTGTLYLLKLSPSEASNEALDFQIALLEHLKTVDLQTRVPQNIPTKSKAHFSVIKIEDVSYTLRLMTWVEGRLWSQVSPINEKHCFQLGHAAAEMTSALNGFKHPYMNRTLDWDIARSSWTKQHLDRFNVEDREIIRYFQDGFSALKSYYDQLPKSVVHNDINDNNILLSKALDYPEVIGLIDFGDTVFTQRLNDLAIAATYAIMKLNDPLSGAAAVLSGYHNRLPINEEELEHLYWCIGMRLVISVTKSALNRISNPENIYLQISDTDAWQLLRKWRDICPEFAHYTFRSACNMPAHPDTIPFAAWAKKHDFEFRDLFPSTTFKSVFPLDLSVGSPWIGQAEQIHDLKHFDYKIERLQAEKPNQLIAGGYLEPRSVYTTSSYDSLGNSGNERRSIHLGIDFWLPAFTPVHAMLDGEVVMAENDAGDKEYGGLVVLKHHAEFGEFYTLYGHLTVASAIRHKRGDRISKGSEIGQLGPHPENGNWSPHLHFQIMLSTLNYTDDFPGVAFKSQVRVWADLCPDPNLLFKSSELQPTAPPTAESIREKRSTLLGKNMSLQYEQPLHIVRGNGMYLLDSHGRAYLDLVNNVAHVGHEHSDVVKAGQQQMALLNTNTRYLNEEIIRAAETLLNTLPESLDVCYFVNSGSEANDLALRMARAYTGSAHTLVSQLGYHGHTAATIDISSYKFDGKGGNGPGTHTHLFPIPDTYRGAYSGNGADQLYLQDAISVVDTVVRKHGQIGALMVEPILSCGGQVELPKGFLKALYKKVRSAKGICISDEVQTGLGRVGSHYWGFELHNVTPDIVTIGKPLGNGHPVAAVVCSKPIADAFANGMEYFNTFGGNPVSCRIAREVLEVIDREGLQEQAYEVGNYFKSQLKSLAESYPIIGEVRGQGLFLGIELVDSERQPLPRHATYLVNRIKALGILLSTDGKDNNVIKIKPPLVFTREQAAHVLHVLNDVLHDDYLNMPRP